MTTTPPESATPETSEEYERRESPCAHVWDIADDLQKQLTQKTAEVEALGRVIDRRIDENEADRKAWVEQNTQLKQELEKIRSVAATGTVQNILKSRLAAEYVSNLLISEQQKTNEIAWLRDIALHQYGVDLPDFPATKSK